MSLNEHCLSFVLIVIFILHTLSVYVRRLRTVFNVETTKRASVLLEIVLCVRSYILIYPEIKYPLTTIQKGICCVFSVVKGMKLI